MFNKINDWINSLYISENMGEEDTKRVLIYPFLSLLGVDIYSMYDCECEYYLELSDVNLKKGFVDICLKDSAGCPVVFIETKRLNSFKNPLELNDAFIQLSGYFRSYLLLNEKRVKCISTDGLYWNFYLWNLYDLNATPVFSFNILDIPKMSQTYFIEKISNFFRNFMGR